MTSFSSQLGYGVSKLISHFNSILLNPSTLADKRMKRKYIWNSLFTCALMAILAATMFINKFSLEDQTTSLKAKASIDRVFHLMEVSTNSIYNMYMYKSDENLKKTAYE